jgi:Ni,Fe-hydrogenase III small subunit/formate hydrogenlyase subunit 6/NADH:ubiquinone oxidoreductase subunit I
MYKEILTRIKQGSRTMKFPRGEPPALPDRLRGLPRVSAEKCPASCKACADGCPTGAIDAATKSIDLGKCLFCVDCAAACPEGAIEFTKEYRLATRERGALVVSPSTRELTLARELDREMKKLFGRSLKFRVVSAGGCGACEADVNVLTTIGWDLGRFGINYVASPRHADGIIVVGPVSRNMELALRKTWDAVPEPKIAVAVGACAIAGGPFAGHADVVGSLDSIIPVDLYIPGCPPHPLTILDGLLRLMGRIKEKRPRR